MGYIDMPSCKCALANAGPTQYKLVVFLRCLLPWFLRCTYTCTSSAGSLQAQVLSEPAVMQLVATMLFVQAKRLHTKLGGMSAAAPPATKQSGRASKKKSAQAGSSNGSSGGTSSASGTQPILVGVSFHRGLRSLGSSTWHAQKRLRAASKVCRDMHAFACSSS